MSIHTTFDLYVSSPKILHCREVAMLLKQHDIACNVTQNDTVVMTKNKYNLEVGCKITGAVKDIQSIYTKIWNPLQHAFQLKCAYLDIHSSINGCIFDIFKPSNCPNY